MKATGPDGQIIYTPPAKAREGLLGYILRVSEANGYDTPGHIFSLAGMGYKKITTSTIPIDKLSRIIGRSVNELAHLPWQCYPNGDTVQPMNDERPQLRKHLMLTHPKICPQCISENGMVDAAWDLRIMLACPKHRALMVDHCPTCRRKLTWFRPGLDRCRCGQRLAALERSSFPQHTIDLLQVIYDTLHGSQTNPTPTSGIPANDLQRMEIDDLLRFLIKVDNAIAGTNPGSKRAPYESDRLECLSGVFANWPRQFHQYLRAIDPYPDQATVGLARRFGCFYSDLVAAKNIAKEKMVFFRRAFGQYGSYNGITPGADPRFFLTPTKWQALREQGLTTSQIRLQTGEASTQPNVVNQMELALHLGVRPITAHRWAELGLFGLEHHGTLAGGQSVYKTPTRLPRKITTGSMNVRAAAKHLGIPVSILKRLRRDGYYQVEYVGVYSAQFSEPDLNRLRTDILVFSPKTLLAIPAGHLALTAFFRMKVYGVENKYQIVRGILDGNLVPAGRLGENIGDIVISGEWVEALRDDMSVHDAIPTWRAAKVLECDPSVCAALVARGELQGTYRGRNLHVTTLSVESFRTQYVSCIGIARRLDWNIRHVLRILSDQGIDLLTVKRTYRTNDAEQAFCSRKQAEKLFGASAVLPGNQEPSAALTMETS